MITDIEKIATEDLIDLAYELYYSQIETGEKDVDDVLESFMLDGFKGFNNMTRDELEEWIKISS